jgi:hypothetical protein|tara:strand:- start:926 stop:1687 length:762 start_codon:yes stop_codon:yes gene_type:complete
MAYNVLTGTIRGLASSSISLTGTFMGDGSDLSFPYSQVPEYVITPDDNRIITFTTTTGKTLRGEANLTFDGASLLVLDGVTTKVSFDNSGNVSASANISASYFYGDGSNLTGVTASAVAVADGPIGSLQFREDGGGEISGSASVLYDFSSARLTLRAGLVYARTAITTHHTATISEYFLGVQTSSVEILFDATQCYNGQVFVIKDEIGSASLGTPITLLPSGSQTIDNNLTVTIDSPYGAANLYTDGVNWFVY